MVPDFHAFIGSKDNILQPLSGPFCCVAHHIVKVMSLKEANRMAKSVDSDQTLGLLLNLSVQNHYHAGFQLSPTFWTFSLLSPPFSQKFPTIPTFWSKFASSSKENCVFPCSLRLLGVYKTQINLSRAAGPQSVIKYFGFNLSAFLEALFWHFLSIMVLKCCSNITLSSRHYIGSKTVVNFQYMKKNQYCIIYILQFD